MGLAGFGLQSQQPPVQVPFAAGQGPGQLPGGVPLRPGFADRLQGFASQPGMAMALMQAGGALMSGGNLGQAMQAFGGHLQEGRRYDAQERRRDEDQKRRDMMADLQRQQAEAALRMADLEARDYMSPREKAELESQLIRERREEAGDYQERRLQARSVQELRDVLTGRGIDTSGMTDAQVRQAHRRSQLAEERRLREAGLEDTAAKARIYGQERREPTPKAPWSTQHDIRSLDTQIAAARRALLDPLTSLGPRGDELRQELGRLNAKREAMMSEARAIEQGDSPQVRTNEAVKALVPRLKKQDPEAIREAMRLYGVSTEQELVDALRRDGLLF